MQTGNKNVMITKYYISYFNLTIKMLFQAFKPVLYVIEGLVETYWASAADDRKIFVIANKLVTHKLDGVLLLDNSKSVRREIRKGLVKSLVIAIDIVENTNNEDKESYKLSSIVSFTLEYFTTIKIMFLFCLILRFK